MAQHRVGDVRIGIGVGSRRRSGDARNLYRRQGAIRVHPLLAGRGHRPATRRLCFARKEAPCGVAGPASSPAEVVCFDSTCLRTLR